MFWKQLKQSASLCKANIWWAVHPEGKKVGSTLSQSLTKKILASYLDIEEKDLPLYTNTQGKPLLSDPFSHIHFNTSHSLDTLAFCICEKDPVGIDIEYIKNIASFKSTIENLFSVQEQKGLQKIALSEREALFFHLWTCREALIKACGLSLLPSLKEMTTFSFLPPTTTVEWKKEIWHLEKIFSPLDLPSPLCANLACLGNKPLQPKQHIIPKKIIEEVMNNRF